MTHYLLDKTEDRGFCPASKTVQTPNVLAYIWKLTILSVSVLALAGCSPQVLPPTEAPIATAAATPSAGAIETQPTKATVEAADLPAVVEYNLGEAIITQSMFPEDSRFHDMPVRLNGIIAVPEDGNNPHPVVVILHGNHPGCPVLEGDMFDRWPCDQALEQRNYPGFEYLVRRLAAEGYVALSININADNTLGFGEPNHIERLRQLVDLHLKALAAASDGSSNQFGVDLTGRADLHRLAFIGHSQGGEGAYFLTQLERLDSKESFERLGYGPAYGLILAAPSANYGGATAAKIPLAVILPSCDGDVFNQDGQLFYEITRIDPQHGSWASSIWLERANHNYFNSKLEMDRTFTRTDCEPLLAPEDQQDFLSRYAVDFLTAAFNQDPAAMTRLGMETGSVATDTLLGFPARTAALSAPADRFPLLLPADASELTTNLAGGSVTAENITTFYCEEGYYTPFVKPGSEPCKRVNLVIPGNPAMVVTSWHQSGAALRFSLPDGMDLSKFSSISLRAAVDPLSPLNNADMVQAFTIQLVDEQGNIAGVRTRMDEPALRFPPGNEEENDSFDGGWFTGRVPLTSLRVPLREFNGLNLAEIREISLLFDQTTSGALFISDVEFLR
jgi:dienelactone hydrolase